jgi:cellulose synthase/poly-beta-1,6-N-acetylglucosamine synthase-like glycosyltransferase
MSLGNSAIVALGLGLGIVGLISLIVLFVERSQFNNVTKETLFYVKKWCLIAFVLLVNSGGCTLVYYTQNLQVIIFIIVALKSKDILMSIMFVFNMIYRAITKKYSQLPSLEMSDEIERVAAFVPVYDESTEQVTKTLDSILNSKRGPHYILPVIISDGKNNYDKLITNVENVKQYTYQSWKACDVNIIVSYGTRNDKHVVFITKERNLGKKDSIILMNDLFNHVRTNLSSLNMDTRRHIYQDILSTFGVTNFDYIFCTDGDTVLEENAIVCLIDTLKSKQATAVAGVVNVNKSSGNFFWNHIQNIQYMYGQYLRRTNEDLVNQVLCLPGCISMIKIDEGFKDTLTLYSSLPNEKNLFETSVQSMGTDRRLTSAIVYTTSGAKILQDTRAHAYTIPPQSFGQFFSQRKRWTHNMFFNSILNIVGSNVNILSRFFNLVDVTRMSLVYFRLFNTIYFIYLLAAYPTSRNIINLLPYIILLSFPVVCFLTYSLFNSHLRNQFVSIFVFTFINKVFTTVSTIITFTLMLFNIGNSNWKISQ